MKTYFNVKRYQSKTREKLFLKLKDLKIDYNLFFDYSCNCHVVRLINDLKRFKSRYSALQYLDYYIYSVERIESKKILKEFYTRERNYK